MAEKERIEKVMQHENMNSALFASAIGIQGSTLSHILNGRNNPSLSVLQAILNRFPNISPEWLIMGQGSMERNTKQSQAPTLFDSVSETVSKPVVLEQVQPQNIVREAEPIQIKQLNPIETPVSLPVVEQILAPVQLAPTEPPRSVKKIIIYYTDNTFQEFQT
jgi:transcriptional regulator with XRE-family HTH domain